MTLNSASITELGQEKHCCYETPADNKYFKQQIQHYFVCVDNLSHVDSLQRAVRWMLSFAESVEKVENRS